MKLQLKAIRVNADLSQQELADKMQVSRESVHNWENGRTKMEYAKFVVYCQTCGVYGKEQDDIIQPIVLPKKST